MSNITPAPAPPPPAAPAAPTPVPPHRLLWRYFKSAAVFLIVAFHLAVLLIRNPLDLWDKEIREYLREKPAWGGALAAAADERLEAPRSLWDRYGDDYKKADRFTYKFTNWAGVEQRWVMFSPPLARKGDFLAVRLEFTDGSPPEVLFSENEPADPSSFFRLGGWQVRKLEDYLAWPSDGTLFDSGPEKRLWEAFARHSVKKWRQMRPGDPRKVERVVLVRRRLYFQAPGQRPEDVDPPTEREVATFDAEGRVMR